MLVKKDQQLQLGDMPFSEFVFQKEHPLLKLNDAIHWNNLLEHLGQFYSPDQGRPTIPLRAQSATEILKRIKNLSDRESVHYVEENMYAQRFCGLHPSQVTGYMNPDNGLANFRKKIGKEGLNFIEEVLQSAAKKKPLKKGNKLIIDTTCVPVDIQYPTDIRLLEKCRQKIIQLIKISKKLGLDVVYRTYSRTARKIFVNFSKLRKPKEKTRNKVHKQMIQFVRRNLNQLIDLRKKACGEFSSPDINSNVIKFLKNLKEIENRVRIIIHQQKQRYNGLLQIPERIVSFHKDHIRPIVRGKFPIDTEFGPKVLVAIVRKLTYVIDVFQNNVSDVTLVVPALRWFKKTFGDFPDGVFADRGFFSREIEYLLNKLTIRSGIRPRGKTVHQSSTQVMLFHQYLPIEARISLGKRKFGWTRCLARNSDHEEAWIRLQAAAMNVHLAFFCRAP